MTMIKCSPLYPTILWERFPYKLNGQGDREMLKVIQKMVDKLTEDRLRNS